MSYSRRQLYALGETLGDSVTCNKVGGGRIYGGGGGGGGSPPPAGPTNTTVQNTNIPDYAQQLMAEFWPGPLTLVFSCKVDKVSPVITGGQSTIAIRCPAHPLTQKLLNQLQIPLVAPSANPFGKISPTTAQHVKDSFPDKELTVLGML